MLRNYLVVSLRNLLRNKTYSAINIFGLAVGMASVLLIAFYIQSELSFDRYHEKADRIYRVAVASDEGEVPGWAGTPAQLGPTAKDRFPEIEDYVRIDPFSFRKKVLFRAGTTSFYESGFVLADPALFSVFDFKLLRGDPDAVLATREGLVISESIAAKYFGNQDPVGKTLNYDGKLDFTVTGVMQDVSANSHLTFDLVASFNYLDEIHQAKIADNWGRWNYFTYVLLRENTRPAAVVEKSGQYLLELRDWDSAQLYLQPLTEIHLRSRITRDPQQRGNVNTLYLFAAIAGLILMIACINFMNLYTANSQLRGREVGVRKVLGARRAQLILQFLCEAFLLSTLTLPLGVLLAEFAAPFFGQITGKVISMDYTGNFALCGSLLLLLTVVGLAAGIYPAFFLSSLKPVQMLRGRGEQTGKKTTLGSALVVFQFAVSIVLITGTLVIREQMDYVRNKQLGYNRENVINVAIYSDESKLRYETFRKALLSRGNIVDVTATSFTPSVERWREGLYFDGRPPDSDLSFFRISGDYNFLDLFGMELLAGRAFDRAVAGDLQHAYVINESALKALGWQADEAVGRAFGSKNGRLIGVVKDFNFRSLRHTPEPLAINVLPRMFEFVSIRVGPGDLPGTLRFIADNWREINAGFPFEYYFLDDEFDRLYKSDSLLQTLFNIFTALAIFVASLGLLGLALFAVQRRAREIGIRKVLGASVTGIVALMSGEFMKLVAIANILAWPVAYILMENWLQEFAYRAGLSFASFLLAGLAAGAVAFLTVGSQTIRSAVANPIQALREE